MFRSLVRVALLAVCCVPLFSLSAGITRTWTGAVNSLFSQPNNWSPAGVPAVDDALVFNAATVTNDLTPGRSFGPITFSGSVTLNGNAMTLTGNVVGTDTNATFTCNANVKIGAPINLGNGLSLAFADYPSMDVNGQTVTVDSPVEIQSLNGTGTVVVGPWPLEVRNGGTFAGTIEGDLNFYGSMPNANVVHKGTLWPWIDGGGALGDVEAGSIYVALMSYYGPIRTKSLHLNDPAGTTYGGAFFDLNATGASDLIQVTGTLTLENAPLNVVVRSGIPVPGQKFELIDNESSNPVSGTFVGLPEGATVNFGGYLFTITYHGGDGNDVVLTAVTATAKVWNGSVNALWSNAGNWTPSAIPVSGEALTFPEGVIMTNDLPAGTNVGPLHFNGTATLNGNPLTLTGDVAFGFGTTLLCHAPLKIGAALTVGNGDPNEIDFDSVDVNGQTLKFSRSATVKSLNGSGLITGSLIAVDAGTFTGTLMGGGIGLFGASLPNTDVVHSGTEWPRVAGRGTLGNVEAEYVSSEGIDDVTRVLKTKSLHVRNTGYSFIGIFYELSTTGVSELIQTTGMVTLENPPLVVTLSGTPVFGQHFLLIDNQGAAPVSGTFNGLPEGAAVNVNGYPFRITYAGGDGNDVELIAAAAPAAAVSQGAATSVIGEPVSIQATVSSPQGTPAGVVTFLDNGVPIGTAPLANGTATLNTSTLSIGPHALTATYSGGGAFFGVTTDAVTHTVSKGDTDTSIQAVHTPVLFGAAEFRLLATPHAPAAGTVAGTFTLREGNTLLANGDIDAGNGHLFLPTLPVGTHTLVASYGGSSTFLGSDSAPFVVEVAEAPTEIEATNDANASLPDGTVVLNVIVTPLTSASVPPTGTITISENGFVWTEQPITGTLNISVKLPGGHHVLTIGYSGDANFLSSETDLEIDVQAPAPSRRRAAHH